MIGYLSFILGCGNGIEVNGVIIFETKTEKEAKKLLEEDPSIKAGIQKIDDFRPIRLSLTKK